MDYILQIEKLFKYFEFNLNLEETSEPIILKTNLFKKII